MLLLLLRYFFIRVRAFFYLIYWFLFLRFRKNQLINLGSGIDYRKGYINVDISMRYRVDVRMSLFRFIIHTPGECVKEVLLSHVINYLYYWEFEAMLKSIHRILSKDGELIIENPDLSFVVRDIDKLSPCSSDYFERVRALFAFDMVQFERKERYASYKMAYRFKDIEYLGHLAGFKVVREHPVIHHSSFSRDIRVKLLKL